MKIVFEGKDYECSDEFSRKNFTHAILTERNLDGLAIYASCFMHEEPDSEVFPENMTGVTFLNCNLDNVKIPPGNTVVGGTQRRFKVQNDLRDWEIDDDNLPTRVLNEKHWVAAGYSVDPADIPEIPIKHLKFIKPIPVETGEISVSNEEVELVKKLKAYFPDGIDRLKSIIPGEI